MADSFPLTSDDIGADIQAAAWGALREGKSTDILDEHGVIARVIPAGKVAEPRVLPLNRAGLLAELLRGVERSNKQSGVKLLWYPYGTETDKPAEYVLRAFTHEGGGFLREDEDVRDGYVWCSGIFENWLPVEDILDALDNATNGRHGWDKPMATISYPFNIKE